MNAAADRTRRKLLGLFNPGNIDGALDRFFLKKGTVAKFPDQPDLTDQVRAALDVLSKNDKGFVLMVESGRIDKYSHSLDWERAVYDTIMLDNAVKVAKDFAAHAQRHADHRRRRPCASASRSSAPMTTSSRARCARRLGIYNLSQFPNYPAPNADGYPDKVDVSRRLAFVFSAYPDYCDTGRPYLDGENVPAVEGETEGHLRRQREELRRARRDRAASATCRSTPTPGVHAADDVVLTAMGPGAEQFRGRIDNTRVFRVMATALGLVAGPSQ